MIEKNWNYRNKKIVENFLCEKIFTGVKNV